jgi:sugar/nucleoside kinase (ribokinase family)
VLIAPDGDITMPYSCGVADQLTMADIYLEIIESGKMLLLIGHLLFSKSSKAAAREALKTAREAGVPVALSIHKLFLNKTSKRIFLAEYLDQADILIGNRDEVEDLFGSFRLEDFKDQPNLLVMTDAANGVLIAGHGTYLHLPAFETLPRGKDSFGAGDQFAAGFLFGFIRGLSLEECGRFGNETAATIIATLSARPTGSWRDIARRYLG